MLQKTIYILRHGQTDFNLQGIVQGGGIDSSLNDTGRAQAHAFHRAYGHLPFEAVLTSKLRRTHETVAPFIDQKLPWQQFEEINEMGWGDHEGKKSSELDKEEYKHVITEWEQGRYQAAMPNGESAADMGARLRLFTEHLKSRSEKLVLVCSHGRAMRGLMCVLKGIPLSQMGQFGHSNTGVWIVEQRASSFYFITENDTAHLLEQTTDGWKSLR